MSAGDTSNLNEIGKVREGREPSSPSDNAFKQIAGDTYSQSGSAEYLKACSAPANAQDSNLPKLTISSDDDTASVASDAAIASAPINTASFLQTLETDLASLEKDLQQLSSLEQLLESGSDSTAASTTTPATGSDSSAASTTTPATGSDNSTASTTTPATGSDNSVASTTAPATGTDSGAITTSAVPVDTTSTPVTTTTTTDTTAISSDQPSVTTTAADTTTILSTQPSTGQQAYDNGSAYYASPDGSGSGLDPNDPTSLANAQKLMENSDIKTVDLEGGTYNLNQSITATGADSGETWQYYQPDGVGSAVLDGGSTNANNGISDIMDINDGSNITVNGLTMQNFQAYGISDTGSSAASAATNNTFENNTIGDNTVTSWQSAGIYTEGWAPNTTIANNYVHDVGSQGIALYDNWSGNGGTGDVSGDVVQGNVVLNAVQRMSDGGPIYIEMHGGDQPTTPVTIADNYVAGQGSASTWGAHGIYLDEDSNNVNVEGNVIGAPNPAVGDNSTPSGYGWNAVSALIVNDGHNDTISNNVIDLGSSGKEAVASIGAYGTVTNGLGNNAIENNVIVSSNTSASQALQSGVTGYAYFSGQAADDFNIQNNDYYNTAGGPVNVTGQTSQESNAIYQDPEVLGTTDQIADGSPVLSGAVNFTAGASNWGPPGFVIPTSGNAGQS